MTELIPLVAKILSQLPELLKNTSTEPSVNSFVQWLSSSVFAEKKKTQETLASLKQGRANAVSIAKLINKIEFLLDDHEELRQDLKTKLQEIEPTLKQAGFQTSKANTLYVIGNNNKIYQGVNGSFFIDKSATQLHIGTGDNIGRDKVIYQYLYGSIDYQRLIDDIAYNKKILKSIPENDDVGRLRVSEKISQLEGQLESFKEDVFSLTETFTKIPINTERSRQAKELFDEGKFREADVILKVEEMSKELESAINQQEKSKKEYDDVQKIRDNIAKEFLIKAQLWATFYNEPTWYEKTQEYYTKALTASRNINILFEYALFQHKHNQFAKAESLYQEALVLARPVLNHSLPDIAEIYNNLGMIYQKHNNYKQAINAYVKALLICNNMNGVDRETILPYKATLLHNYANLLTDIGEYDKASEKYEEALSILEILIITNKETYLPEFGKALSNLATLLYEIEDYENAVEKYDKSLEIRRKLVKDNLERYLPEITNTLINSANLYVDMKNFSFAERNYLEALDNVKTLSAYNPYKYLPLLATTLNNIASFYSEKHKSRDLQKAETYFEESLSMRRKLADVYPDVYNPDLANSLSNLSIFYLKAVYNKEKSIAYATESIKVGKIYQHNSNVFKCLVNALKVLESNGINIDNYIESQ